MKQNMFPEDFYTYLNENTLVEVKGGTTRKSFLHIWLVVVEGRVFGRSWNKSEKSWFTAAVKTGVGAIKYGEKILEVKGRKVAFDDPIQHRVSQAYIDKYHQPENIAYAEGIAQKEYFDRTLEFVL